MSKQSKSGVRHHRLRRPRAIRKALVHGRRLLVKPWRTALYWFRTNTFTPEWLPQKWRYLALGYLVGVLAQVMFAEVDVLLRPFIPPFLGESLLTLLAVVLIALTWGVGPSVLATLIGAILVYYFFAPRLLTGTVVNRTGLISAPALLVVGLIMSICASQTQRAHRDTQRLVRQLDASFAAITDAVLVYDRAGHLLQANPAARSVLGFDVESPFASLPLHERGSLLAPRDEHGRPFAPEQWPPVRVLRGETLSGTNAAEAIIDTPDGRKRHFEVTGAPIVDTEGRVAGGVCVFRDVTERRRLERRTREALDALLAMAEALVLAPEAAAPPAGQVPTPSVAEAPLLAPAQGTAKRLAELMVSALGCQRVALFTLEPETEVLRPLAVAGLSSEWEHQWWTMPPVGRHLHEPACLEVTSRWRTGETLILDRRQPPLNEVPDAFGIRRTLAAPMRVRDRLVGLLFLDYEGADHEYTSEELTLAGAVAQLGALVIERERLQREREEAQANERAMRETNRRMEEFLIIASHELKTPLTSLQGNIQVMARRLHAVRLEVARAEDLAHLVVMARVVVERSERSLRRISLLVDDMLDDARMAEGHLELRLEPCDLATVVHEAVEEQRLLAADRTICLELPVSQCVPVLADAGRIGQVVTNYLTNALKYSGEDRPVVVRVQMEGEIARVSVRDEGVGLPLAEQAHVWERFYRAAGVAVQSGSGVGVGIGLYISKSIIEGHHGQVGVDSVPGQGSTFWFTLPLTRSAT